MWSLSAELNSDFILFLSGQIGFGLDWPSLAWYGQVWFYFGDLILFGQVWLGNFVRSF